MIRYAEDKPKSCEYCYFWNEKKKECRQADEMFLSASGEAA